LLVVGLGLGLSTNARARDTWSHETLGAVWAAPAFATDGKVYVGSEDGFLYAFDPGGRLRWVYKASDGFSGWPVWLRRGILAVANRNGTVYFFDERGEVRAKTTLEGIASGRPTVRAGRVFLGTSAGKLAAVDPTGLRWVHDTGSPVTAYPAADAAGIYVGCNDGSVIALDPRGNRLFRVSIPGGSAVRGGVVARGKRIVVATEGGVIAALNKKDGAVIWHTKLEPTRGGVSALPRRGVVVGSLQGKVHALDEEDGKVRFSFAADGPVNGTPLVTPRWIIFGTDRGTLYVLDHGGAPWSLRSLPGGIRGGLAVHRGRVAFGATDRRIYMLPIEAPARWQRGAAARLKGTLKRTPHGVKRWRRDLSGPVASGVRAAPEKGGGGRLLAGTWGNRMFVLDPRGKVQWSYNCGADVDTLPVMDSRGRVAFGCNDGGFYGLRPDGELRYRLPVNKAIASSPAVTRDGTVYFGARDRRVYAVDAAGKVVWRIRTGGDVDGSPRVSSDGIVYIGSDDRHLYAINPIGHIAWYHKLPGAIRTRPALSREGAIYATAMDQRLYAITPDGQRLWDFQTEGQILSYPATGSDGSIFFGSRDRAVYAVDAKGNQRWRFVTAGEVDSHPCLSADGKLVFAGSDDGNLYALGTADGMLRWWYPARAAIRGSLVARPDGSVVFGTMDGAVVAVGPPRDPSATKPPPRAGVERFLVGQGRFGPPVLDARGTLMVAGVEGTVRAYGTDRWPLWSVRVSSDRLSRPTVLESAGVQHIYVTDTRGNLGCVATTTVEGRRRANPAGKAETRSRLRFRLRLDQEPLSPPATVATGQGHLALAGTRSGRLWAVTPAGKVRWFYSGSDPIEHAPLALGRTILVAAGSKIVGVDLLGHRRWDRRLPAGITAGPVAVSAARAMVGDGLGHLFCVSAAGAVVWKRDLGSGVLGIRQGPGDAAAAITADGRVLEVSVDGELLLERSPAPPPVEIAAVARSVTYLVGADGALLAVNRRTGAVSRRLELSSRETHVARTPSGGAVVVTDDGWVTLVTPDDNL
jgi:outer membrane protein assembly factor BamB